MDSMGYKLELKHKIPFHLEHLGFKHAPCHHESPAKKEAFKSRQALEKNPEIFGGIFFLFEKKWT